MISRDPLGSRGCGAPVRHGRHWSRPGPLTRKSKLSRNSFQEHHLAPCTGDRHRCSKGPARAPSPAHAVPPAIAARRPNSRFMGLARMRIV